MNNLSFKDWAVILELPLDRVLVFLAKYTEAEKFALMDPSSQEGVTGVNGVTMIHMVIEAKRCSFEKIEILKALETRDINIYELQDSYNSKLPMLFFKNSHKDAGRGALIQHVLENIDDVNELAHNSFGTYAHLAVGARDMQFIRSSYEAGMDYSIKTKIGMTTLEIAQANAIMDNGEFLRGFIAFNVSIRLPLELGNNKVQVKL